VVAVRTVAIVSGILTAGICNVTDDTLTDDVLIAQAAWYKYTIDSKTYADGSAPYIDTHVGSLAEFRAYLSTIPDPN
jgi:hypothetical protein